MTDTPHLGLPYLDAAQAQKHVTHNEALRILDACVHLAVVTRSAASPPATSEEGARYLVPAGATGAFAGRADAVAAWQDGAWRFLAPRAGWRLYVAEENRELLHDGGGWRDADPAPTRFDDLVAIGLGATADAADSPRTLKFFAAKKVCMSVADVRDPVSVKPAVNALPLNPNK